MPRQGLESFGRSPVASASVMMTDSTGMERSAATGVGRSEGEPAEDLAPVDVGDLASREVRQDLFAKIVPVRAQRSGLPEPRVALEHGPGDGLEERLPGAKRSVFAASDRG